MGVVLNPVAYRVGYKYSWKDAWYTHRLTYSAFIHDVLAFKALMFFVFFRYFSYKRAFWLYSHANVYIFNNKIFVNLYLYDANEVQMYYDVARRYKKVGWYRLNAISGWFKNHFFDRKSRLKRFHYFTRTIRFIYDLMAYEDFRYILRKDRRTVFKLKELHYKKTIKPATKNIRIFRNKENKIIFLKKEKSMKAIWLPWEEIKPFRLPFKNMVFHMNHFSVKWWSGRFRLFYNASIKRILKNEKIYIKKRLKKISKIKRFKFKKNNKSKMKKKRYFRKFAKRLINKKLRRRRELANIKSFRDEKRFSKKFLNKKNLYFRVVRSNNRLLFTFLAFFNKLFKNMTFMYDLKIFRRKWVRKILRFYVFFFLRKAIIKIYGKIAEYFAGYLNINFNIKLYILNNNSVGAIFISRFIAIGLRNKFDYLDMIIPIRKSLRKQMYARKWSKLNLESYKSDFLLKKKKLIIAVTPLKDIFFFRMQLLNNYLKFRSFYNIFNNNNKLKNEKFNYIFNKRKIYAKKFNNKFKFHYFNFKLLNNLKLYNNNNNYLNTFENNNINFKVNKIYINSFVKMLNSLRIYNFKSPSNFFLRIVKFFLLSKNISFIFYKSIWYRVLFFRLFWKFLNKKMFFYYIKSFLFNKNNILKNSNNFLKLIHFVLLYKTNNKLKIKKNLKFNNYIVLKNRRKSSFCLKFFRLYKNGFFIKKLKKASLKKKLSLPFYRYKKYKWNVRLKLRLKNKKFLKYKSFQIKKRSLKFKVLRFNFKLKRKKKIRKKGLNYIFKFKYKKKWKDIQHKKRKLKFKMYKNKKFRKKYNLRKKKRFYYFKKKYIKNTHYIYNISNNYYFYKNYLFNTNKYNNFILNSFYNKKASRFFLYSYFYKKRYKNLFKNLKLIKRFKKFLNSINNSKKYFLSYKKFTQLHRKIKNSYELYTINKSILFDRIEDEKLSLKINNKIIIKPSQLVNFSFINLIIVYKLFRKRLKRLNININYYNKRFKYFANKKGLKNKKYELNFLHLFSIIRYYYKIFSIIKYFIGFKYKINNYNFLLNYNMKIFKFNKFLNNYKFNNITSMITHDKIKNIFFYSFTDINNFNYKFNVNVIGLKNRFFYYRNYKIREKDVYFGEKYKYPLFFYNKTRRMKFFDDYQTMLYGYKFHFVGRFTRKQQAANLWYKLGSLANASAVANVDYAFYTVILRYSVCTVKVWLYRSRKAMKYKYRVF